MPGFVVEGVGDWRSADTSLKPIYNYTWKIASLFEELSAAEILAKDISLPTFTVAKESVEGSSLIYKYAGMVTWEDVKVTFYDITVGSQKVSTILKKWRSSVWSTSFGIQSPQFYKKDSKIDIYDYQWEKQHTWTLHGSWPQSIKEGDLTYTSTDVKVIDVIISYDWAVLDEQPGSPSSSASPFR